MGIAGTFLPPYLLLLTSVMVHASGFLSSQEGQGNNTAPSSIGLARCKNRCGNLTIEYPFGIGPGCFRNSDFELICDDATHPPKLFLCDGTTQLSRNIVTTDDMSPQVFSYENLLIPINISYTIPMRSGVDVYDMHWYSPGKSFPLHGAKLNIIGCDFDAYLVDGDTDSSGNSCTSSCPAEVNADMEAGQICNGTGCCSVYLDSFQDGPIHRFHIRFVRHAKSKLKSHKTTGTSIWDRINITSSHAGLQWSIVDQPKCADAKENKTSYACISEDSMCIQVDEIGYYCSCNDGYGGNPYILDGCSRDTAGT